MRSGEGAAANAGQTWKLTEKQTNRSGDKNAKTHNALKDASAKSSCKSCHCQCRLGLKRGWGGSNYSRTCAGIKYGALVTSAKRMKAASFPSSILISTNVFSCHQLVIMVHNEYSRPHQDVFWRKTKERAR